VICGSSEAAEPAATDWQVQVLQSLSSPLYIFSGESLVEHTGWCENDFNVHT
jgi:hypothetical protein